MVDIFFALDFNPRRVATEIGDSDVDRRSSAPAANDQREAAAKNGTCLASIDTTMDRGRDFPPPATIGPARVAWFLDEIVVWQERVSDSRTHHVFGELVQETRGRTLKE